MYKVKLSGSYYNMGYIQGKLFKEKLLPGLDYIPKPPTKERANFTDECEIIVRKYTPEYLEELQGFSDGSGIDYELVKVWPLALYSRFTPSCSIVAIPDKYTVNGKPLIIRNYDYFADSQEAFTVFWTAPKHKINSIGFCDLFGSRYGGVNERGLAIAISSSPYSKKTQPGYSMSLTTKWVLDSFSTTKEAVNFLEKVPHFHGFNFLIFDLNNNMARVETCPDEVHTLHFQDDIAISTNHYLSEKMKKYELKDPEGFGSSLFRYNNVYNWFNARNGLIDQDYAIELASSHEKGICDHFKDVQGGTVWSWIHSLGDKTMLVSQGSPCKNSYTAIDFDFTFSQG